MSEHDTHAADGGRADLDGGRTAPGDGPTAPGDGRTHLFDDPKNVDRFVNGFYVVCVVLIILDFVVHRHISHSWENLPAFHALYGFGACWILVVIAKQMRRVLMRDEDYYDGD